MGFNLLIYNAVGWSVDRLIHGRRVSFERGVEEKENGAAK